MQEDIKRVETVLQQLRTLTYQDGSPVYAKVCLGPLPGNIEQETLPCAIVTMDGSLNFKVVSFVQRDGTPGEEQRLIAFHDTLVEKLRVMPRFTYWPDGQSLYRLATFWML